MCSEIRYVEGAMLDLTHGRLDVSNRCVTDAQNGVTRLVILAVSLYLPEQRRASVC